MPGSGGFLHIAHLAVFFILLFIAAGRDFFYKKIDNKIILVALPVAVVIAFFERGVDGLLGSVTGFATAFSIFFPLYFLGGIGAGDTKLMAAVGALTSWRFIIWGTFFTAVSGLFVTLIYIAVHKSWRESFKGAFSLKRKDRMKEIADKESKRTVPYALAICVGCIWALYEYHVKFGVLPWQPLK